MNKLLATVLVLAAVAAAGWLYMTPVFALQRLQVAAEAGDADALRELVDFPAVRQSIKDEARATVADEIDQRARGLGPVGAILAGAVVDRVVDVAVQPQGIAALTRGERPGERDRGDGVRRMEPRLRVERGYESVDRFVVTFTDPESGAQRVALVLRREGLVDWKLAAVRLGGD